MSSELTSMSRATTNSRPSAAGAVVPRRWRRLSRCLTGAAVDRAVVVVTAARAAAMVATHADRDDPGPPPSSNVSTQCLTPCFVAADAAPHRLADASHTPSEDVQRVSWQNNPNPARVQCGKWEGRRRSTRSPRSDSWSPPEAGTRRLPLQARSQTTGRACARHSRTARRRGRARAITTGMIAKAAGVSIGWLYDFFPNRESIFDAIVAASLDKVTPIAEAVHESQARRRLARGARRCRRRAVRLLPSGARAFACCGSRGSRARR